MSLVVVGRSWGKCRVVIRTFLGPQVVFGWSWGNRGVVMETFSGSVVVFVGHGEVMGWL